MLWVSVKLVSKAPDLMPEASIFSMFFLQTARKLKWRDPDSNRGHHDFQARPAVYRRAPLVAIGHA
jgi:hypothetical protein